jgi:DNA-directed RNA polymerase subunit RPC12/RpoP
MPPGHKEEYVCRECRKFTKLGNWDLAKAARVKCRNCGSPDLVPLLDFITDE